MSEPDEREAELEDYETFLFQKFRNNVLSGADDLSAELIDDILQSFQAQRLASYFVKNPRLALPVVTMLRSAQQMQRDYPTASFVFALACVEIALRDLLLIPILHGLIDSEPLAPLITKTFEKQRSLDLNEILLSILKNHADIDPKVHLSSADGTVTFEKSYSALREKRNGVLHRAAVASIADAEAATILARIVLEVFFVRVLKKLGLHLHGYDEICDRNHARLSTFIGPKFEWHPDLSPVIWVE